jgi:hypothetical protein
MKAPGAGMSPLVPNCAPVNPAVVLSRYHVPVEGRKTAGSILPSPSKSAGEGLSSEIPNCVAVNELLLLLITYQ